MDERKKKMYSEMYSILEELGEQYKNHLPPNLLKMIEDNRDTEYNPKFNLNENFRAQHMQKETFALLALFHLNYWCDSETERLAMAKLLKVNEEIYQRELVAKYSERNQFERKHPAEILREIESGEIEDTSIRKGFGTIEVGGKNSTHNARNAAYGDQIIIDDNNKKKDTNDDQNK